MRLKAVQVVYGAGHLTGVAAIGAGDAHTCAIKTNDTVWCWGWDYYGQLGDGTRGDANHNRLKPVQVVGLP
jgi:alpha-tubulin suppressor-like RCC1 family protein